MYAEQIDERPRLAFAHSDRGNVKGWRLVGLAHVTGPLGMEKVFALRIGSFSFGGFITLVAWIEKTLEYIFRFGDRIRIHRPSFDDVHWAALNCAGDANFVTTLRQDHIVETAAGNQRARGGHTETHRQRNRLVVFVMLGDDLPHVRAGRRLESTDVVPAKIHPVIADVAAAFEVIANYATDAAANGQF